MQKDAHWIQMVKKQKLLYVRLTPYSYATKPSSEFTYTVFRIQNLKFHILITRGTESAVTILVKKVHLFKVQTFFTNTNVKTSVMECLLTIS